MSEIADQVQLLRPRRGDVVAVFADIGTDDQADELLAAELGAIADATRATFLLMPAGTKIEELDEREMLARGWLKVTARAHVEGEL